MSRVLVKILLAPIILSMTIVMSLLSLMITIVASVYENVAGLLVSGIMNNLNNTFNSVNTQVGAIATEVGTTPASFSPAVFNMIRNLSENVIMPIAGIGHNPFELAALLTVLYEDYTEEEAQEILETIFEAQYELEIEEVVETRTRTVTDDEGNESEEEYDYYILNVKLTNEGIRAALDEVGLTVDQIRRYARGGFEKHAIGWTKCDI